MKVKIPHGSVSIGDTLFFTGVFDNEVNKYPNYENNYTTVVIETAQIVDFVRTTIKSVVNKKIVEKSFSVIVKYNGVSRKVTEGWTGGGKPGEKQSLFPFQMTDFFLTKEEASKCYPVNFDKKVAEGDRVWMYRKSGNYFHPVVKRLLGWCENRSAYVCRYVNSSRDDYRRYDSYEDCDDIYASLEDLRKSNPHKASLPLHCLTDNGGLQRQLAVA